MCDSTLNAMLNALVAAIIILSMYLSLSAYSAPALGPTVRPWYGDEYEASLSMSGCQ